MTITQDDIFNAVLKDRLETDFLAFVCYFHKQVTGEDFIVGKHHRMIVDALMDVYRGK